MLYIHLSAMDSLMHIFMYIRHLICIMIVIFFIYEIILMWKLYMMSYLFDLFMMYNVWMYYAMITDEMHVYMCG